VCMHVCVYCMWICQCVYQLWCVCDRETQSGWVCCSVLQCVAVCCSVLQCVAVTQSGWVCVCQLQCMYHSLRCDVKCVWIRTATHCNILQHTATHCNTLHHTATHCNTLQHDATYCNTLQHTATRCSTLQYAATHCNTLQHTATYFNTLQHTATHCNTLHDRNCGVSPNLCTYIQKWIDVHTHKWWDVNSLMFIKWIDVHIVCVYPQKSLYYPQKRPLGCPHNDEHKWIDVHTHKWWAGSATAVYHKGTG